MTFLPTKNGDYTWFPKEFTNLGDELKQISADALKLKPITLLVLFRQVFGKVDSSNHGIWDSFLALSPSWKPWSANNLRKYKTKQVPEEESHFENSRLKL